MRRLRFAPMILMALATLVQGCGLSPEVSLPANLQASPFVPPTSATALPIQNATATAGLILPSPTLPCQDNLSFISDLTVPDGSTVEPGATLDKRWEVRNSGTCNWDERYSLRLVAGDPLGAKEQQALFPARSGVNLVIRIVFQAPVLPGSYRSAWQAYSPSGDPYGDPIFIAIVVTG